MIRVPLQRYEKEVAAREARPVTENGLLLYGSSFFTNWGQEAAQEDLAEIGYPVVNHGFGGAMLDELLYYYHRLVKPCRPRLVLLRGGVNDIYAEYTMEEITGLLARLCEWCMTDFPEAQIGLLPIFDLPRPDWQEGEPYWEQQQAYNRFCREYAAQYPALSVLDVNAFFYEDPQAAGTHQGFKPIFQEDGLHLIREGYIQFGRYLTPLVRRWCSAVNGAGETPPIR